MRLDGNLWLQVLCLITCNEEFAINMEISGVINPDSHGGVNCRWLESDQRERVAGKRSETRSGAVDGACVG